MNDSMFDVSARQRATRYLERHLENINDPYEVAITAYALTTAKSPEANAAYGKLLTIKREKGGKVYWSRSEIKINNVRYEFNRPYLQHKVIHNCQCQDEAEERLVISNFKYLY